MALASPRMPLHAACDNKENCGLPTAEAAAPTCGTADPLARSATCAAAADPLARSGSTPAKGKVSALARMFAARLQAADAAPTAAARGNNAERVAAIRRRFAAVANSQTTAVALRLPGAPAAPRRVRDCDTATLCVSVVQPRVDDAARLRVEVEQLQSQLIKHVAEVSLLRVLLSEAAAAPAAAADLPSEAAVDHEDISALASRIADAERAEGELDAAADEIAALEEALEAAEQDAEEAAAAVDAAAARAQDLQCELTSVRGAAEADAARAREQEASLQASLQEALRRAEAAEAGAAENAALCKALCEARAEAALHEARCTAAERRAEAAEADTAAAKADAVAAQARASAAENAARAAEQDAARVCNEAAATKAAAVAEIDAAESAKAVAAVMRDALALAAKDVFAARTVAAQLRRRNTKLEARRAELADSMTALMQKVANLGSALSSQPASAEVRQPAELLRISAQVKLLALDAELTGHSSGSVAGSDADAGEAETSSQLRPSSVLETDLASLQLRLWELTAENERLHGALAAALPVEQCKAIRAGGTSTPMRQDKEALEEQLAVLLADRTAVNASFAAAKREVAHLKQRVTLLEGEHDAALAAADDYAATATRMAARVGQLEAALGAVHAAVGGSEQLQVADGEAACTTPTALRKRGAAVLAVGLAEESERFSDGECSSPSAADLADDNLVRMRRAEALLARAAATPSVSFSLDCGFESAAESDTPCALTGVGDSTTPALRRCRGVALLARAEAPSTCRSARKFELTDDEITDCDGETSEQLGDFSPCPGSTCSTMSRMVE